MKQNQNTQSPTPLYVLQGIALLFAVIGLGLGGYLLGTDNIATCSSCRTAVIVWMFMFGEMFLQAFLGVAGVYLQSNVLMMASFAILVLNSVLTLALIGLLGVVLSQWRSQGGSAWESLTVSNPQVICQIQRAGQCSGWTMACAQSAAAGSSPTGTGSSGSSSTSGLAAQCPNCLAAGVANADNLSSTTCQSYLSSFLTGWAGGLLAVVVLYFVYTALSLYFMFQSIKSALGNTSEQKTYEKEMNKM